jgi:hypothetical protein
MMGQAAIEFGLPELSSATMALVLDLHITLRRLAEEGA